MDEIIICKREGKFVVECYNGGKKVAEKSFFEVDFDNYEVINFKGFTAELPLTVWHYKY